MSLTQEKLNEIIKETTSAFTGVETASERVAGDGDYGIFDDIEDAIAAAVKAQKELMEFSLEKRGEFLASMRSASLENVKKLSQMANEETGYGRLEDKILKNTLAVTKTPGLEDLVPRAFTGDFGLTLEECAPYGVIGSITPSTNPTATVINNSLGMVTAGNAVVFNPHPAAKRCSCEAIRILNKAVVEAGGPNNLMVAVKEPTMDSSKVIMTHKAIRMLSITGGEAVVNVAMKSGKKVIAAGPGNPPVIVDDTANIKKAGADIVNGAGFDNNVLCIAEKEIIAFDNIADELMAEMVKNGAYKADVFEVQKLIDGCLVKDKEGNFAPNKKYVGKNASYILEEVCGFKPLEDFKVIICDVDFESPLIHTEMLMPVLPLCRVRTLDEAIEKAVIAENDCKHTAIMHSENVVSLSKAARALDTTIFVKNAPSYAGLGFEGEGYTTLTISTPTGEGLTSPKSFSRSRRCTLHGSFRIV